MPKKTVLHQLQTMEKTLDGMSYVIEAEDGSLIVIDGGMNEDADPLYDYLKTLCGGKDPVVDLWIITHAHADHYNCMMTVAERHSHEITVKKVMFDFQPRSFFEKIQPAVLKELDRMEKALPLFVGVEKITPRTGDRYEFGGTVLEVLYTASDLPPLETAVIRQGTNDGSLVFCLCAEGQTVLFLGDVQEAGDDVMIRRYGKSLKCDVCQIAHHGAKASTCEFYDLVDPEIVLWPSRVSRYEMFLRSVKATYHLLKNLHVKDIVLSGNGTRRMELPIRVSEKTFFPEVLTDQREEIPQFSIRKASRTPEISDFSDSVWEESESYVLQSLLRIPTEPCSEARILWTEDALWWRFCAKAEIFPESPDRIGTVDSNNLRFFFTEDCVLDLFGFWWDRRGQEGLIENVKFYLEDKNLPHGISRCSRPEVCEAVSSYDGSGFTVCARIPFVRPHKKGDLMGLNFEFTLMAENGKERRVRDMLQTGEMAQRCGIAPAALCFAVLK